MAEPRTIGRYQILRPLGQGGMGTVYLAEDPLLKRRVAIKVVRVTGAARHQATLRFRREAEISAQLNHPNLVTVFDVGVEEDLGPFLTMEYVEGKSLGRHIKDRDLDTETSARVLIQAMRALRAAHRRAIVHRDVKPDNILLSEEGRAKLMDFGIARTLGHLGAGSEQALDAPLMAEDGVALAQTLALRLTSSGDFLGSPAYAPPEVLRGGEGTPASDRYSFAATAFELLTGKLPHPGGGLTEIILHILQEPVAIPADLPPAMGTVFRRALAADPDDRYTTLPEFMEELVDALPGPVSMRARLFTFLGQDEDGTGSVSTARFRQVEPAPAMESGSHEVRARGTAPVKITLAEDPVETYLTTRKRVRHEPRRGGTDWPQVLKWIVLAFLVLQLFWWLAPTLSHFQF
ncbi:serine/threonine-protein kinase [Geothrix oryzisoli]|uniref:serine/threonine-protein kinase n=1 Tax=Geothrix oryzisoli TaxID=2922721 RepID=UPI001FADB7BD|nr:serine/threonine-protein kinase [Geothrix oryzisoli]